MRADSAVRTGRGTLDLRPEAALLAAAVVACGGHRLFHLGFYHDDWAVFAPMYFARPGLASYAAALVASSRALLFRPFDVVFYACQYACFGLNPVPWQLTLLGLNFLLACAVHRLLRRYGAGDRLALLGAALFLAYPSKDATMFWPIVGVNSAALLAFVAAFLAHLEFVATRRRAYLAASAGLLLLSLCTYDQCFFFAPLWPLTPTALAKPPSRAAVESALCALGVTALFAAYKFWFVGRFLGVEFNKTVIFSAAHVLSTYRDGVAASLGPGLMSYALTSALDAFRRSPVVAAAAVVLPWALFRRSGSAPSPDRRALVLLGLGVFALGYLPVAFSDYYAVFVNHMNRLNQAPALGLALAAAGLAPARGAGARLAAGAGCALAAVFLAAHVAFAEYWMESYRQQLGVRDLIRRHASEWPVEATLLLMLPSRFVADKAPIFIADWDIGGASAIWTDEPRRRAMVLDERTDFTPAGVAARRGAAPIPYESMRLLIPASGTFTRFKYGDFKRRP